MSRIPTILAAAFLILRTLPTVASASPLIQTEQLPPFLAPVVNSLCLSEDSARSEQDIARDLRFYDFLLADKILSPDSVSQQIQLMESSSNDLMMSTTRSSIEKIKFYIEMIGNFRQGRELAVPDKERRDFDYFSVTHFFSKRILTNNSFDRFSKNLDLKSYQELPSEVKEALDTIPSALEIETRNLQRQLADKDRIPRLMEELEFVKAPPAISLPAKTRVKLFNKAIRPTMVIFRNPGFKTCGLSTAEMLSLELYTGQVYIELNRALWKSGANNEVYKAFMDVMNSALSKLNPYDGTVLRGVDLPPTAVKDYQVGHIITYPTYLSTSLTSGFLQKRNNFTLRTHSGRYIGIYARGFGENEVLLAPNTKFKVLERKDLDADHVDFVMEEMP